MKRRTLRVLTGVAATALAVSIVQIPAQAAPTSTDRDPAVAQASKSDDLKSPLSEKQRQLRETAVKQVVKGTAKVETKGGQSVINMGKGQYVQYAVNREESIFTILSDFGTLTKKGTRGTAGPAHNQIPSPDRVWDGNATDDNSTSWTADFNKLGPADRTGTLPQAILVTLPDKTVNTDYNTPTAAPSNGGAARLTTSAPR